jgi:hypothetical protein
MWIAVVALEGASRLYRDETKFGTVAMTVVNARGAVNWPRINQVVLVAGL